MSEPSIHQLLRESFSPTNKEDWVRIAAQELSDKSLLDKLRWSVDNINFSPYYTSDDVSHLQYLKNFQLLRNSSPSQHSTLENLPRIRVENEKDANAQALKYLATGADGLLFDVTTCIDFNISDLLEKIIWPYCTVSFITPDRKKTLAKIFVYAQQKRYMLTALRGSLWVKTQMAAMNDLSPNFSDLASYRPLGLIISPSSPVQEISQCLEQATLLIDFLTNAGVKKELVFRAISLSVSRDENFFCTVAKLKAMRMMWYQLSRAFEINAYSPNDLHLHLISEKWISEPFQPHGNLIKNTIDALAARLGGCNGLTLCAEDERSDMMSRTGLHVGNILKLESHLDHVSDPLAGSYFLDNMVHEFAKAGWLDFQNRMRRHEA